MARSNRGRSWVSQGGGAFPIVVLASGNGSNLQAILNRFEGDDRAEVVGVASNKPSARALQRAQDADVPTGVFARDDFPDRLARDLEMARWIEERGAELIVSAGYLEILSPEFVERFRGRIINIHPSRLPKFRGLNAIERAYRDGSWRTGVTLHFIDEGVDTGPVIKQRSVWRRPSEGLDKFEQRIHKVEHKLFPKVIAQIASGKIQIGEERIAARSADEGRRFRHLFAGWGRTSPSSHGEAGMLHGDSATLR